MFSRVLDYLSRDNLIFKKRQSGVLLHITSLPNQFGIGDIGPQAYKMIDRLVEMGQSLWQILPTNPPDNHNCPYSASSAFANNPYFISPELLVQDELLSADEISNPPKFQLNQVDFNQVIPWKKNLLQKAIHRFRQNNTNQKPFKEFCQLNSYWLNDFALFEVLREHHNGKDWIDWEIKYRSRSNSDLDEFQKANFEKIESIKILQFIFDFQWRKFQAYAISKGIQLIGDIPIYIAYNSVDVWANNHLFKLDESGKMITQSGCPPDFFIEDGQVWGHPIYDWEKHKSEGYNWWLNRMRHLYSYVDIVRIDHFNGFVKYWEIPANHNVGKNGIWVQGPKEKLFKKFYEELNQPQIMAEDLGEASFDAIPLREAFDIPGMKILQMSFSDKDPFKDIEQNLVVYTGTHDNDTTVGWYQKMDSESLNAKKLLNLNGQDVHWPFIEYTLDSAATTAIIPMQDILGLDSKSRMNTPGIIGPNWEWRFDDAQLTHEIIQKMKQITIQSNRVK